MQRWASKIGLEVASFQVILVPVNLRRDHWVLVDSDAAEHTFLFNEPLAAQDTTGVVAHLHIWLEDEVTQQMGAQAAVDWDVAFWTSDKDDELRRQQEGGSCGVFVLFAADVFSEGAALECFHEYIAVLREWLAIVLYIEFLTAPPEIGCEQPQRCLQNAILQSLCSR